MEKCAYSVAEVYYVCIYVHVCTYVCMYVCMYVCTCMCICIWRIVVYFLFSLPSSPNFPYPTLPLPTPPPPHISFPSHSLPSPGTLCDFEDECGDMYFAENDGLAYRHLTRRLFLRYTEDVSMSVSCIVY